MTYMGCTYCELYFTAGFAWQHSIPGPIGSDHTQFSQKVQQMPCAICYNLAILHLLQLICTLSKKIIWQHLLSFYRQEYQRWALDWTWIGSGL